jgi:inosine/xanthosine triphosphatase
MSKRAGRAPPAADELLVAVGSTNPVKLRACERAFAQCFPSLRVTCYSVPGVRSGVPDQPLGAAETERGALHRARNALKIAKSTKAWAPHFAVGIEGGIATSSSASSSASGIPLSSSISSSSSSSSSSSLDCIAVMAVVERETGRASTAAAARFALPPLLARLVRGGMELGDADDVVFARTNSKQEDGTVGILTRGVIDRTEYYVHPLVLALVPFVNKELYDGRETTRRLPRAVAAPTAWQRYAWQLRENPVRTKALTAAVTTGLGSVIGQVLSGARVSLRRALAFGAFGLGVTGPVIHFWTAWLAQQRWAQRSTLLRTAVDRLAFHPPFQYSFFVLVGILMGKDPLDKVLRDTNGIIVGVVKRALVFWPPAMYLIFKKSPPQYHALFSNLTALVWSSYLGLAAGSK